MTIGFTSSFGLPSDTENALRALGPRLDAEIIGRSRELFAKYADHTLPEGGARQADLAYGDHPGQTLDLCRPKGEGHPIALFVPGGGFTGGDKAFYAHIPYFLARQGFLGVAANYRLARSFNGRAEPMTSPRRWTGWRKTPCVLAATPLASLSLVNRRARFM